MALARGPLRTQITRLANQIDEHLSSPSPSLTELRVVLAQITKKFEHLEKLDEAVLNTFDPETQQEEFEEEFERISSYSDKVVRAQALVQDFEMEKVGAQQAPAALPRTGGSSSTSSGNGNLVEPTTTQYASAFRVPEFKLPQFDGKNLLAFPSWFDQYKSLIDSHPGLMPCQKLGILRESLTGNARTLIGSLSTTNENYAVAMRLLEENFNDPSQLLCLFVTKLHGFQPVLDSKSQHLQTLVFQFESVYCEIVNLIKRIRNDAPATQAELDLVSYFLTPHLLSRLPDELVLKWHSQATSAEKRYSFEQLVSFLKEEIKARTSCTLITEGRNSGGWNGDAVRRHSFASAPRTATHSLLTDVSMTNEKPSKCVGCDGDFHPLWRCQSFKERSVPARRDLIAKKGLCFACFRRHHVAKCRSNFLCRTCGRKHNSLLCPGKDMNSPTKQPQRASESRRSEEKTETHVGVSLARNSENVYMQIIKVKIINPYSNKGEEVYGVLDSGSSRSWVERDLAERLALPTLDRQNLMIKAFGGPPKETEAFQVGCSLVHTTNPNVREDVQLWTCSSIAGMTRQRKFKKIPSHLSGLPLSDAYDGKLKKVSVIIGADFFFDICTGKTIRGSPCAVETLFGWTLLGKAPSFAAAKSVSSTISLLTYATPVKRRRGTLVGGALTPEQKKNTGPPAEMRDNLTPRRMRCDENRKYTCSFVRPRPSSPFRGQEERVVYHKEPHRDRITKARLNESTADRRWTQKGPVAPLVGDVVILQSHTTPRNRWCLGKVIELLPGRDGATRVVRVLSKGKEMLRAVSSVFPLEVCEEDRGSGRRMECPGPNGGEDGPGREDELSLEEGPRDRETPIAGAEAGPSEAVESCDRLQPRPTQSSEEGRADQLCARTTRSGRAMKIPRRFL